MSRRIRKQTRGDFDTRVRRVDPFYAATGASRRPGTLVKCRLCWALLGFAWVTTAIAVAQRPDQLKASLAAGSLPPEMQHAVMSGLAILLCLSAVGLAVHLVRAAFRRTRGAQTSRPILAGGLAALMVAHAPAGVVEASLAQMVPASQDLVQSVAAKASALGLNFGALADVIPG